MTKSKGEDNMRTDDEYKAIVNNFEEFAQKIQDFQETLETSSNTAEAISDSSWPKYPSNHTGFGHWIQSDLAFWRNKYGDNVVGAAIEEIEPAFPQLNDPHFFYWTTDTEIQGEIEKFTESYKAAFEQAAETIAKNLDRIAKEQREQREEEQRKREEERAQHKVKTFFKDTGEKISGAVKNLGSKIRGFFRRG